MNGNCYFSEGINPTLTCNKNEGNRVAIPVDDLPTAKAFNGRNVVHDCDGIARTVISSAHSGNEPKVAIPVLTPDRAKKDRMADDSRKTEKKPLPSPDRIGMA